MRSPAATSPRSSCRPTAWTRQASRPSPSASCRWRRRRASPPWSAATRRIAGRVRADGIHVEGGKAALADMIDRMQDKIMVGAGGAKTRDDALELGEERPDYMFFGRFGYDTQAEPHRRNLALGQWWAEMIEIPCIVLAGNGLASVEAVAATGAEFVGAVERRVRATASTRREAVASANRLLDETRAAFRGADLVAAPSGHGSRARALARRRRHWQARRPAPAQKAARDGPCFRRPSPIAPGCRPSAAGATPAAPGATPAGVDPRVRRQPARRRPRSRAVRRQARRCGLWRLPARSLRDRLQSGPGAGAKTAIPPRRRWSPRSCRAGSACRATMSRPPNGTRSPPSRAFRRRSSSTR